MTGVELIGLRRQLLLSQASMAVNCGGNNAAFTATDIATAEALGTAAITNTPLNNFLESNFRRVLNFAP